MKDKEQDTVEFTQSEVRETMDLVPQEIVELITDVQLEELTETRKIEFKPVEEVATLDDIIEFSKSKLEQLKKVDVNQPIEKVIIDSDGTAHTISVQKTVSQLLAEETQIAGLIDRYKKILATSMKERRMLSGQMYGPRNTQLGQVSKATRTKSARLTGDGLMANLRGIGLNPSQEMEKVEQQVINAQVVSAASDDNGATGEWEDDD